MKLHANIHPDDSSRILFTNWPYSYKDLLTSIPGASYSTKTGHYSMPLTWEGCLYLDEVFGDNLVLGDELTEWAQQMSGIIWDVKQLRMATDVPVETDTDLQLYPHQRADVRFLYKTRQALICSGLGSGKTFSGVAGLRHTAEKDGADTVLPILVACPNSVKEDWKRTFEKLWPELKVEIIKGTPANKNKVFQYFKGGEEACPFHNLDDGRKRLARVKVCTCPKDVLIINWEAIRSYSKIAPYGTHALVRCTGHGGVDQKVTSRKCQAHTKELNEIQFNSVIGDEIHRIKSGSALQTRAFKAASDGAVNRIGLTGTPIADTPDDLWSILNWLKPEAYPSRTKYVDLLCQTTFSAFGSLEVIGVRKDREGLFYRLIDPVLRRMPNEIILPNLPPIVRQKRFYELSPKQQRVYDDMASQMVAQLDDGLLKAETPLVRMTRLLEFSLAYAELEYDDVTDPETGETYRKARTVLTEPSSILDAFMDDLPDYAGEPIVVFSMSKKLLNLLGARLDKAKIKYGRLTGDETQEMRQVTQDAFQAGKLPIVLCTPAAAGTGTNLNRSRIAIYLGRPWSSVENLQSEGRVRRIGSEQFDNITYIDYYAKGTVQEAVANALERKEEMLQVVLRDSETFKKIVTDPGSIADLV